MTLHINYNNGHGHLIINLADFIPCNQPDLRKVLSLIAEDPKAEEIAGQLFTYLTEQAADMEHLAGCYPEYHEMHRRHTRTAERLRKLAQITAEKFGLETETTNNETNTNKEDKVMTNATNTQKYFAGITTLEQLRTVYKNLLKANHPDNGGDVATMQEINAQYDEAFKLLKSGAKIENETDGRKWSDVEDQKIREALSKIIFLHDIKIEIVGCWIWVDGNTYPVKDIIKNAGFEWSKSRKKWHFCPYETAKYYKGSKKSFGQLRQQYGSLEVESESRRQIA